MDDVKGEGLYLMLLSIHGLIRGKNPELGKDADTGGQILYLLELARALGEHPEVARVDLLTRRVEDQRIDDSYAEYEENLNDRARIVRIDCGPKRYLRKETLWPHLDGFIDGALKHIRTVGRSPDLVHGHYADGGLVAARLAGLLGVPMVFTGHSLGRDKLRQLLNKGQKKERIEKQYNISQRIEAEEIALGTAEVIVASTRQEVESQYLAYDNYHPRRMHVVPPGVNISRFRPPGRHDRHPDIYFDVARFLDQPDKPMILALSRADERKNIASLVRAYGQSTELQEAANLVLIAGNRDIIRKMDKGPRQVLSEVLMLVDEYDLYGHISYPKHHRPEDVPALYRMAASHHGVFVNPALTEPFGLTIIEAAASGLPVVATHDGGPVEIIENCQNGFLVDPMSEEDIAAQLLKVVSAEIKQWNRWSRNGLKGAHRHYSWQGHAESYLGIVRKVIRKRKKQYEEQSPTSRIIKADRVLFTALDNTLIGSREAINRYLDAIKHKPENVALGIATARTLESSLNLLEKNNVPVPNILVTSVGTEIHYRRSDGRLTRDGAWREQLNYRWDRDALMAILKELPGLRLQAQKQQREYKISYHRNPDKGPTVAEVKKLFRNNDLHAKVVVADGKYMDVLPIRASKGLALRYISMRWGIPLDHFLVVGDSGNDEEMLQGDTLAVAAGTHSPELDRLQGTPRILFAKGRYADAIIEGIEHYCFFGDIRFDSETSV